MPRSHDLQRRSVICCALRHRAQSTTEQYNPLLVYSIHSCPTLRRTLVVNLIYWFAQSVPTFSGSTTQPGSIPRVLYSAKPRPNLGLHPREAVYNTLDCTLVERFITHAHEYHDIAVGIRQAHYDEWRQRRDSIAVEGQASAVLQGLPHRAYAVPFHGARYHRTSNQNAVGRSNVGEVSRPLMQPGRDHVTCKAIMQGYAQTCDALLICLIWPLCSRAADHTDHYRALQSLQYYIERLPVPTSIELS